MNNFRVVVTTIQPPTQAVMKLHSRLNWPGTELLVIGDQKGPPSYDLPKTKFFSLSDQSHTPFTLAQKLPIGHYSRKNLGYLEAIRQGADCIYETDDDNAPLPSWDLRSQQVEAHTVNQSGWVNVYRYFSNDRIWPRGFPLDCLIESFANHIPLQIQPELVQAPIQQGLANGSPDVDAIWRLVLDQPFTFENKPSIYLPPSSWCPFNSQSTWWWPVAYPLMYLPSYCSFRMTDIWRSFIAQRCLWELGYGIVFHPPEVEQERNAHNLMKDFEDEVSGYLNNASLVNTLKKVELRPGEYNVTNNLIKCYDSLVKENILHQKELMLLNAWVADLNAIQY